MNTYSHRKSKRDRRGGGPTWNTPFLRWQAGQSRRANWGVQKECWFGSWPVSQGKPIWSSDCQIHQGLFILSVLCESGLTLWECIEIGMGFISALEVKKLQFGECRHPQEGPGGWPAVVLHSWEAGLGGFMGSCRWALGEWGWLWLGGPCLGRPLLAWAPGSQLAGFPGTQDSSLLYPRRPRFSGISLTLGDCTDSCACHLDRPGPGELDLSHKCPLWGSRLQQLKPRRGGGSGGLGGHGATLCGCSCFLPSPYP